MFCILYGVSRLPETDRNGPERTETDFYEYRNGPEHTSLIPKLTSMGTRKDMVGTIGTILKNVARRASVRACACMQETFGRVVSDCRYGVSPVNYPDPDACR